jgi:hypothetical protein
VAQFASASNCSLGIAEKSGTDLSTSVVTIGIDPRENPFSLRCYTRSQSVVVATEDENAAYSILSPLASNRVRAPCHSDGTRTVGTA